jgi:hypothetical protein
MKHTLFFPRLALAVALLFVSAPLAHAQFVVGAGLYSSLADGSANPNYLYSTNTNPPGAVLPFFLTPNGGNGSGKSVAIPLANGANNFTFTVNNSQNPGPFAGLELFFDPTATPYNPGGTSARTPDLIVFAPTTSTTTFTVTPAGKLVESYDFSGVIAANGLTTFTVAGKPISITAFSTSTFPNGSFTVLVGSAPSGTPEPGALALLAGVGLAGSVFALRRRK